MRSIVCTAMVVASGRAVIVVPPSENMVDGACVDGEYEAGTDFFPSKTDLGDKFFDVVAPDYSLLWNVSYHGSYKRLTHGETEHILYQCGTPKPEAEYPSATFWQVPVRKVATTSTTYIPLIEMIGERARLEAYASSMDYVSSPCLRKMHRDGDLAEAYDSSTWSRNDTLLEELEVDITFTGAFSSSAHKAYPMPDISEDSVLKIAEYVEVVALFFNREAEATKVITQIAESFACAKDQAASLEAAAGAPVKVLWSSHYQGTWSVAQCPNWYCEIIEAAGGKVIEPLELPYNVSAALTWGVPTMTTDQVREVAAAADVWIVPGVWDAATAPFDSLADVAVVANGRLFDHQGPIGARNWFERRTVEPDVLIQDVAATLYPGSGIAGRHTRKYLRDVASEAPTDDGVDLDLDAACPDVDAPYELQGLGSEDCHHHDTDAAGNNLPAAPFLVTALLLAALAGL